jgi:hypothetical protein
VCLAERGRLKDGGGEWWYTPRRPRSLRQHLLFGLRQPNRGPVELFLCATSRIRQCPCSTATGQQILRQRWGQPANGEARGSGRFHEDWVCWGQGENLDGSVAGIIIFLETSFSSLFVLSCLMLRVKIQSNLDRSRERLWCRDFDKGVVMQIHHRGLQKSKTFFYDSDIKSF